MRGLAIVVVVALSASFFLGGTAPLARVLLAAGFPSLAAPLFSTADWRGVAQFRAGAYKSAARSFEEADEFNNLGIAEAFLGNHAAGLEAFDQAIARGHPDAQANFDVLAAFYAGLGIDAETLSLFAERKDGPTAESFIARGDARAAGTGSEVTNNNTMLGLAQLDSRGRLGVRQVFDDKFIVADDRWLRLLSDVPGEFLAARIAQEHKRRIKLGLSPPAAETPE
ncbi:hypothetical protein ACOTTU_22845 [Roseobacter sp. EG26]|uniref:hypothetical protein n=1 Tax=Roseobacter sp. EG26 TaxID=3412477 RepID=UPI002602D66C|nr:hypothetical protein [uncultured Roseobacter sp.]